jgi:mono/diheme cytochrome c family protein
VRLIVAGLLLLTTGGIASAGGSDIFNTNCIVCHQADAKGVVGMYPPLADSIGSYVAVPAGRVYLVHVVSFGMTGPISVHDQTYNGLMQPWPRFTDDEIAQVLNYVLTSFNAKLLPKDFAPLTSDEVARCRASNGVLGSVHKEREALMKILSPHHGVGP